jgi:hypothetical protein
MTTIETAATTTIETAAARDPSALRGRRLLVWYRRKSPIHPGNAMSAGF